jgi:hypothetical protein
MLAAWSLSPAAAQVSTPQSVAERVADQVLARTGDFRLVPRVAAVSIAGAHRLDVFAAARPHAGGVYVARTTLSVKGGASSNRGSPFAGALENARIGISHAAGSAEVYLNGELVLRSSDDDPAEWSERDYSVVRYEHVAQAPLTPGDHAVRIVFTPSGDGPEGGRIVVGVQDGRTGMRFRGTGMHAPLEEDLEGIAFAVFGPTSAQDAPRTLEAAHVAPGADGKPVRWTLQAPVLAAAIPNDPLDYVDWRYFSGTVLDALTDVSSTFEGLDYTAHVDAHLDFFLESIGTVAAEREALGLTEGAFGHYFRYALLDDFGMQTVPHLWRLSRGGAPVQLEGADGALVARALDRLLRGDVPRLPNGAYARVNPDSLTVWADDLFMGGVLLARAARSVDGPDAEAVLHEAARQVIAFDELLRDPVSGLYYHGYFGRTEHASSSFWGRANAWAMMAKVEVLYALPPQHPQRRAVLRAFRLHAEALARVQAEDGRWHQVLDNPETYHETTATAAFTRAFAEGIVNGWLPAGGFREATERGWAALARQVRPDGTVEGIVRGTPILFDDEQYDEQPTRLHDPRGVGAVLYAAASMERLHATERSAKPPARRP